MTWPTKLTSGLTMVSKFIKNTVLTMMILLSSESMLCVCVFSHVLLFAASWTVACQSPLSVGFSRHEYWSGLLFPTPGDLSDPGIEPLSLEAPASAGGFFTTSATWDTPIELAKKFIRVFYHILRISLQSKISLYCLRVAFSGI